METDHQEKYLKGITLRWRKYAKFRDDWERDHCEFCGSKFMENPGPEIQTEGYTPPDTYRWIYKTCFEDFKDMFEWRVT